MTDNAAATSSNPPASTAPQMPASTTTTAIGGKDSKMGITSLLTFVILTLAWIVGFSSRLFAIVRFESIIHEFDPWFNYRSTAHMVENGFYEFMNWFDERAWYPLGRIVGGTVFPGLMFTSGAIHYVLHALNFPIHIREVCVFLAPFFSGLTAIATYLLTKELWSAGAGLFAACFIAIAPGYTSRSVAGSYDNEGIAIFALQFTYFLWLRAVRTGSITWGILTAISYFYMCLSWGGFVLLAMQLPFIGYQPVGTSEHMAAFGVFGLMQLVGGLRYMRDRVTKQQFYVIFVSVFTITIVAGVSFIVVATWAGYIQPWTGRFYSLWDTGYAKIHIPIIASVSEHQPTTWLSFFFDLHITVAVFPAGLWICVQNLNDARVFVILYAVTAAYFAGVMVRLMLTFTPVVCRDEAAAREERRLYDKATSAKKAARVAAAAGDTEDVGLNTRTFVSLALMFILLMYVAHCTYVTSNAYSHPSVVLQSHTNDGGRNTPEDARIMSWWDYGYQIAGMANRTTLVDNNTWNNSHIALVGMAMSSNESFAFEIMKELDVDYVLVIFGGVIGYSGDDINKFLWMVRIAEGEHPKIIREADYFTESGEYSVGVQASKTMTDSIMYRMSYYRFGEVRMGYNQPGGFDRTRGYPIGVKDFELNHLEEAYTSENWLVRVFRVVDRNNRPDVKYAERQIKSGKSRTNSKKSSKNKKGVLKTASK
ncbi:Dolichyl-diphosphooligosaccharide--protein glycotransferase [Aphelenchoides fujianensis]|nr:Dolichyl-diphosphooligosaccharide--protein glycotransferase [Aphelenchoides fujianensis]